MSFMQREVTDIQTWLEIDGNYGLTFIPFDVLSKHEQDIANSVSGDSLVEQEDLQSHFGDYYDGRIDSVAVTRGYGARLSAPGYMDCTEWSVYASQVDAEESLNEFGDEETEE